ncbi:Cof-type HAD-IIB family hydrolase [Nicoliella spurrieriana]|uniref:Cof-type HAD-IIB family hydrolase n=1 Tax=Nicoliella spurrieriana TaxID=2925830 RepID=A0A976RRW3_9LACO|nr:Cof-type HAD-IIB family hydrolase [Nicoliella spurrieriana]UQS86620.1 Cof-type HAD-IIB family hydrolase [Nicoliella spurrieriana]
MTQKLIALDLDGTTLNNDSQVSEVTSQAVQKLTARGHIVSIVTGRSTRLALPAYQQLKLTTPMINFNGSLGLIPNHAWSGEYEFPIQRKVILDLLANREKLGINIIAAEDKKSILSSGPASQKLFETSCGFFPDQLAPGQILNPQTLIHNPIGLAIDYNQDKLAQLESYINDEYGNYIEIAHWGGPLSVLEIKRAGVDKAYGVKYLAKQFNIDKSNIIAIGDQVNDLPLLSAAGTKVAMKNAVDSVKAIADVITPFDNQQNGVAKYLMETFN